MSDVFLSYANVDREGAAAVAEALGLRGYSVWWDRTIPPGRVFDEVIQEALAAARCVLVLWSRTSVSSNWVKSEAAEGAGRHVLVPAVIDNVVIPIEFRRIQAANLQGWTGDASDPEFERLLQSVERLSRAGQAAPPRLDSRAPGGLVRTSRHLSPRAVGVGVLAIAGAVLLAAIAFWPTSDAPLTGAAPAAASADQPGGRDAGPAVTTENSSAPEDPAASGAAGVGGGQRVNLLALDSGGTIVAASSNVWTTAIDGKEDALGVVVGEAVFAFRDERAALFDTFTVLVSAAGGLYLRDFELLAGNESPTGSFQSLGTFRTRDIKLFKTPYQEFTFPAVRAKYLKVRAVANHAGTPTIAITEFQLWGIADPR